MTETIGVPAEWKCAGCGAISPSRHRSCHCTTNVVYMRPANGPTLTEWKVDYEAPRDPNHVLKVRGVGKVEDEPRALIVYFDERPTDDELRALHEHLRWWYEH